MAEHLDFEAFCLGQNARLIRMLTLFCGDAELARDLTQETLVRTWVHWRKVRAMERPDLWAKRVALNLATSQFRRRRTERIVRGRIATRAIYSPDGTSLVFQADLGGGCIYRSDAQAQHLARLTQGCSEGFDLSWSPDGRWIIWAGGAHGPADAEVMAADGSQRHTIVDDTSVAYTAWQPPLR